MKVPSSPQAPTPDNMPTPTYLLMAAKLMAENGRLATPPADPLSVKRTQEEMENGSAYLPDAKFKSSEISKRLIDRRTTPDPKFKSRSGTITPEDQGFEEHFGTRTPG